MSDTRWCRTLAGEVRYIYSFILYFYKAYLPRYIVGGGQAEYKLWRVDGREDNIVIRVGNSLILRQTNKEDKRAVSLRELIRRC